MSKTEHLNSKVTAASLLIALGIIYGDIGTSPLYALRAVIGSRQISTDLVYGGVSCIFWTLFFQTTIKYIWLTLKADNQGEGGIFSLYALVRRHSKKLVVPAILGATTLLADGIITPPISVSSAVEGLRLVHGFENIIVPGNILTVSIVIIILSVLFFVQRFGTETIGKSFGPIMVVWFLMLAFAGLRQIIIHPGVFSAINPYYAYNLLANYPNGFWLLGAVFLCATGAEALYSDLGHCGVKNIRITWGFVKFSLLANYLGQAAWIMHSGYSVLESRNPFFEIIPSGFILPAIIIATLAAIIASQALISGSFTLINEAMNLNFWPKIIVRQPTDQKGQIFIPSVNNILWFGCILMIVYFKESSLMEAAYGFSISITMLMTTLLLSHFLIYELKWKKIYIYLILIVFSTIEISFFVANVAKIKERWMFLFFEFFIFTVMYIWYNARKISNSFTHFIQIGKYSNKLRLLINDTNVPKFSTHLVFLTKANTRHEIEERILKSILSKKPKRADKYWFVHINRTEHPYTLDYSVTELIENVLVKIDINVGFRVQPRTELYFKRILKELIENKEFNLHQNAFISSIYNVDPDIKFVAFEKFLSVENDFRFREGLLIKSYFKLKKLGLDEIQAFGLEKCDVEVEHIPLVFHPIESVDLLRIY